MGFRPQDSVNSAAHAVEQELNEAQTNPQAAHDKLLQQFLTMASGSARDQDRFLFYLQQDDPDALQKVEKMLPELKFSHDPEGKYAEINANISPADRAAYKAAASIAETGQFGDGTQRNYIRNTMDENTSGQQMADKINQDLAAIGVTHRAVGVEHAAQMTDPDELVVREDAKDKRDALVLNPERQRH
ncbi:MAG TPA: hypothetical protein V6C81_32285 [Planktothrix sp.]|jgi:hypothetical protein